VTYTQPLLLCCCGLLLGGLLFVRTLPGRRAAWCGLLALFLVSWPPADWLFCRPLEARYPVRLPQAPRGVQAIVVLGSAIEPPQLERPYALPDYDAFKRCEYAIWIYRQWGQLPILACEGRHGGRAMSDMLTRAGIPQEMIWLEGQSRSTHENAVFGAAVLHRHGIERVALVTDAQSMPRAEACFRKEGLQVFPAPSEFRTFGNWRDELLPGWHAVQRNEITLHEMLGTAWYWFRGWI
jgi:uncharacterized SAM-binding protein YcdF (DUF218 family)